MNRSFSVLTLDPIDSLDLPRPRLDPRLDPGLDPRFRAFSVFFILLSLSLSFLVLVDF